MIRLSQRYVLTILALTLLALVLNIHSGQAAYPVVRPISNGQIDQGYKYGASGPSLHKGVDFAYSVGTSVYAIASGTVVDLREDIPNGTPGDSEFGNFVLIQHDQQHYDRINEQMAYVYSMYLHLSRDSVMPAEDQHVNAGQLIAQTDTSGNTTGPHLHLQIVIHPEMDRQLYPNNTLDSENRSRNPELWLKPYNNNTATAIGKLTDLVYGDPLVNKVICGLEKPYGSYTWSRTYSYSWTNPDDILVENWATTDISPGTYHLYAYNYTGPNTLCSGTPFRDLGTHTFTANKITYVGLYPVALPFVRGNFSGWNSTLTIRNNSNTTNAQINTTYFYLNGEVHSQRTDVINANGNLTFVPPSFFEGSAQVVASEDIAVSVLNEYAPGFAGSAYLGVSQTETSVWIPLVHRANSNLYNLISIQNVNSVAANVSVSYKYSSAGNDDSSNYVLQPYETKRIWTSSLSGLGSPFIGSAIIASTQPLAVTSQQYRSDYSTFLETSNAVKGGDPLYAPLIQNNNYGIRSGLSIQNAHNVLQVAVNTYYQPNGSIACTQNSPSINPQRSVIVYPAPAAGCTSSPVLSAILNPTAGNMAVQVNQVVANTPQGSDYLAMSQPTNTVHVPRLYRNSTGWSTGLQIQNTGSIQTTVTVAYYNSNGTVHSCQGCPSIITINAKGTTTIYPLPVSLNFTGSAKVTSSSQPITVIVNHLKVGGTGDILATHEGLNR